jgi:hypothetical protein
LWDIFIFDLMVWHGENTPFNYWIIPQFEEINVFMEARFLEDL